MALRTEIVIVTRFALGIHDVQSGVLLVVPLEISLGMRDRQQIRKILVAILALVRRDLSVVTRRTRVHLGTTEIGSKFRLVDTDVAFDALRLLFFDVFLVIDHQVPHRCDVDTLRLVAEVTERTFVLQFIFVTTDACRVIGNQAIGQLLIFRYFLVASLAFDANVCDVLLMVEFQEFWIFIG